MGTEESDFLYELEPEIGEIQTIIQECPGVYYLSICDWTTSAPGELYVVSSDAVIPAAARAFGQNSLSRPELLLFPFGDKRGGQWILAYEICKYKVQNHIPLPEGTSLYESAVFGREHCPGYFGPYPTPSITPWGPALRYRTLDHGIHWIETEQCALVLSVCYPLCDELSGAARCLARQTAYDLEHGIDNTLGCLFFSKEASCVPILELMATRPAWEKSGKINRAALMNAVITYQPEYTLLYNIQEQQGLHDLSGMFLKYLGADAEPQVLPKSPLSMTEQVGTEFYLF